MRPLKVRREEGRKVRGSALLTFSRSNLLTFFLLPSLCSFALASSASWQVPGAVLKFTIEADPNQPQVPGIDISGRKSSNADWSGAYYRIDGKTYKNAIAMTCPGKAAYGCREEFRRFTALIGVREDAGKSASIVFEVYAGTRKLYASPPLTKYSTPIGIDVRLPPKTKELRLAATGSSSEGHHWAGWVNAGFQTRENNPKVGYVTLPVPGFDPAKYEVAVFTANGARVGSHRLGTPEEGRIDLLFFGGQGWTTYYAYLVPKDKYEPGPKEWAPDAGLVLETRRADKSRQRECEDLAGLVKVWNSAGPSVGLSLVTSIHHGYPVHPLLLDADSGAAPTRSPDAERPSGPRAGKNSLALYRYTGFFEADRAGEYIFATASNWGSHLLVDDKPVVSWPGNHDYREGIKGQKQGRVTLQPGVHKLDYFNFSPWGTMFTLAAWQPPGGKLGVMTGSDFPSVRGFVATGAESDPASEKRANFDWDVVDDWRLDRDKAAMIRMKFQIIPDRRMEEKGQKTEDGGQRTDGTPSSVLRSPSSVYRWTFDDGIIQTGRIVERVFFSTGKHTAIVQMLRGDQVLAETSQTVYAGARADKIWAEPRDPRAFKQEISQIDFRKRPIPEVVRLYTLGNDLQEPSWKNDAEQVLLERVAELVAQPQYQALCLELGQHLCVASLQRYDQAMSICTKLQEKTAEGSPTRQQTMVLAGELSLRCLGKPDTALRLLNLARWEKAQDKTWTIRHGLARAEALLALGQMEELAQQMRQLGELQKPQDVRRQELRHAGLLHQAQSIVNSTRRVNPKSEIPNLQSDDPSPLDTAMDGLQAILYEDPQQVLSPGLNLIRLDVHLGRGEYGMARHLAERLAKLEMTPYDRALVLVRHVKVLCAMGDPDSAKKVLEELTRIYPNSEQASQAKAMFVEAATKLRTR
jgi:tetratricopeptide (TPR) repeat protein